MDHNIDVTSQPPGDEKISQFRQFLPQAFAAGVNSLLFFSAGMQIAFPALLVPVFTILSGPDEASWYGAVTYVCHPLGAIASGAFLQSLGCKKLMILINVPLFVCWMLVYFAESTLFLHIANACAGATVGLMEAPAIRYITEVSHATFRGTFTTLTSLAFTFGVLFIFLVGSVTDWRNVALISAAVPILSTILLVQVPETPMWLMSKGRPNAALKSLQWLRGWTAAESVKEEFEKIEFYRKKKIVRILHAYGREVETKDEGTQTAEENETGDRRVSNGNIRNGRPRVSFQIEESEKRGFADKWRDLTRREMLEAMGKCFGLMSIMCMCGVVPLRPYLVRICSDLQLPVRATWTAVWVTLLAIAGCISCALMIRLTKKKPLLYFSYASSTICLIILAITIKGLLADGLPPVDPKQNSSSRHWLCLAMLLAFFFCNNLGTKPISFVYLGELLPYRGRGVATGIVMSSYYCVTFFVVKGFSAMEMQFGLHSIFYFFAAANIIGIIFTYFLLPETEGRHLADIETEIMQKNCNDNTRLNTVINSG